jgi:radical SAM protein with 4Fe4S-binding SPASM domain
MLLKGNLSIHERNGQYLAILSEYPYWMIVNEAGKNILELCYRSSRIEDVISYYAQSETVSMKESTEIINDFLHPLMEHGIFNLDVETIQLTVEPVLIAVCINITRNCNLTCPHCYASGGTVYPSELSASEIRAFLQEVKSFTGGAVQIQLTGGEPFLEEEKVFAAIDEARNLGYSILIVNTNGILLDEEKVNRLKNAVSDIEYFNITVSLDGATKTTHEMIRGPHTFEKTLQALRLLKKADLPVAASIAVHQGNFHELEALFQLCTKLDVVPYTSPLAPLGRAKTCILEPVNLSDLVIETYRIIKKHDLPREKMGATYLYYIVQALRNTNRRLYCGSGLSTLFLDSNGDIYPCMNTLYQEAFKCGNIRTQSFKEIWEHSPVYTQMRCLNIPDSNEKCKKCELRYICAGYCRGLTYAVTGDLHAPFIWCDDFKKALMEAMWILSEEPDLFEQQAKAEFVRYGIW